jgi:hypothetical protein
MYCEENRCIGIRVLVAVGPARAKRDAVMIPLDGIAE